jgi:DNA repair protein SbcC/Rad50
MRILGVRFKNLNSLAGEWEVDFTHPAYDGLFAITGPTGAGKTTILDAVCLGLYGRTPRLERVTKSSNEVMSRRTGECFAEVTFETQQGRYRCHWSQHRARKRPDGELQQARHEISDVATGTVLESRFAQVSAAVEAATGMNFDRFTRSMLLAQGGFAAFLQAPPDERAPILEQITGTGIYSQISMKVHERHTEEREKLDLLQAELKGIRLLGEDEERALQTALSEKRSREAAVAGGVEDLRRAVLWLERVAALEKETAGLEAKLREAAKRREEFAPESRKLERARKALALDGGYRAVAVLRAQQAAETAELSGAAAALPVKESAFAGALAGKGAAEAALNEARIRQQREGEIIKQVRDLDVRLGEQKARVKALDRRIADAEGEQKGYAGRIADLEGASKLALAGRLDGEAYLAGHAADAGLAAAVAVVARGFAAIRETEARHAKALEAAAAAAANRDAAVAALGAIETDHERTRSDLEAGQRTLAALAAEIAAVLQGRPIDQWRKDAEALKDRERLLVQTAETVDRMDKTAAALDDLRKGMEALTAARERLAGEVESAVDQKALREREMEGREREVLLRTRIRNLEEERTRLEDGKPCPLCGAADHPYARGNIPALSDAEAGLNGARAAFREAAERLGAVENERVRVAAEIGHAETARQEREAALATDEGACADAVRNLGIAAAPEERAEKVRLELAAVGSRLAAVSGIVATAEERGKVEQEARTAGEALRGRFDASGRALQDARHSLETAGREQERLVREGEELAAEIGRARAAALRDVMPFGVAQLPTADLDAVLTELTRRKDAWQARLAEKAAVEKRIADLTAQIDRDRALAESLAKELAARRAERGDLAAQLASLGASRRELFGEKDARREEARLAEAVTRAEGALEKARAKQGRIEGELGALRERIASLNTKTGNRAAELARSEGELAGRIREAGFADEADYRAAALGDRERQALAAREDALMKETTELAARRGDRAAALAAEREKRLTERPAEALREEMTAGEAELRQIRLDIGGMAKGLSDNEALRERQRERLREIDAQKRECARWSALHDLIGSADGKKFRNFAQGLTFEMMTVQANRRLAKMTDRYLLIRDPAQPLELNVIDNYQAGEIRSTKNLSGGESFIVSLALALGLSHMVSRNVRIDSLFLDEGFGTLDEEALETALETLAGLRQDGKLIGVISHVTALKERIAARIQVTPGPGGRSRITGPGCRGL